MNDSFAVLRSLYLISVCILLIYTAVSHIPSTFLLFLSFVMSNIFLHVEIIF